ncbi:MAG: RpoL/Rpb11 RNA polymerase subunit family protein [Candidatus Thorarchaeota archaeon]
MNLKILKNTARELELEIEGEGHTLCNPLREILFEDKHLTFAGYSVPHPLTRSARFIIRTDGKMNAINVFKNAAQKLIERTESLRTEFKRALKAA